MAPSGSATGLGLRSRRLVSCQSLGTTLISSVPPLTFFGRILSDVLKELDCTKLIDAQETTHASCGEDL